MTSKSIELAYFFCLWSKTAFYFRIIRLNKYTVVTLPIAFLKGFERLDKAIFGHDFWPLILRSE